MLEYHLFKNNDKFQINNEHRLKLTEIQLITKVKRKQLHLFKVLKWSQFQEYLLFEGFSSFWILILSAFV